MKTRLRIWAFSQISGQWEIQVEAGSSTADDVILTTVEGWTETPQISRNIHSPLARQGQVASPIATTEGRRFNFSFAVNNVNSTFLGSLSLNNKLRNLTTAAVNGRFFVEIEYFTNAGIRVAREHIYAYADSAFVTDVERIGNQTVWSMAFFADNPTITYEDASTGFSTPIEPLFAMRTMFTDPDEGKEWAEDRSYYIVRDPIDVPQIDEESADIDVLVDEVVEEIKNEDSSKEKGK